MYQVLRLLRHYPYREEATQQDHYGFKREGIDEKEFVNYLKFKKRYLEHWKSSLKRIPNYFVDYAKTSKKGLERAQKRSHAIQIALDECRDKGYLKPKKDTLKLKITAKGWRFSGVYKIKYSQDFLKEYDTIFKIIIALVAGIPFFRIVKFFFG